jgi:Na+/phosphate symporter
MAEKHMTKAHEDRLKDLCPLVDTLRLMIGAARHAFNRHSQTQLEEMARLRKAFTLEIDPFFQDADKGLPKGAAADRTPLLKFKEILAHLELMAEKIGGLADHLRYKAKTGAILSDHDFYAVNNLFSTLTGFMRALVDIFELNDPALKAYVLEETRKLTDDSFRSATAHETGMADTPGQSKAWSVYLAILSASREIAGRLADIVKSLD